MNSIWRYLREELFCPETNLFYDCRTSRDPVLRFEFLPTAEEIAADFPNPCGWSTGMEDCMLNAGSILDTLALENEAGDGDPAFAGRVLDGIFRCTTVHGRPGFVVRGLSPRDGKSCYSNSSRDQFSLAVYGTWRYLRAFPEASDSDRERARFILRSVAEFCEQRITPENDFDLGRLDGGRALVSKLWNCAAHEALRLPMIYAAAFEATSEDRWLVLARRYAAQGTEMKRTAGMGLREFRRILAGAEAFSGDWGGLYGNWRLRPMMLTAQTLSAHGHSAVFGGKTYLNPIPEPACAQPNALLRGFGNALITIYSDDDTTLGEEERARFARVLERIDFSRCSGSGPVQLLHGFRLARRRGAELSQETDTLSNQEGGNL